MKKRFAFVDFLRAACVFYIVGFWHLMNYTAAYPTYYNSFTVRVTVVILGLFVFLSGYLLAQRDVTLEKQSLKSFFASRILRIYPLYFSALCIFLAINITNLSSFIKASFVVSMFYGPPPPTLWFITMLLVFYLVAPILISTAHLASRFIVATTLIFLFFLSIILLSPTGDARIVLYFPAFALGIYFSKQSHLLSKIKKISLSIAFLIGLIFSIATNNIPEESLISIPIAAFGPAIIFMIAEKYGDRLRTNSLVAILSFSGFVMYLLHRPIYQSMRWLYFPTSGEAQIAYLAIICFPLIIAISWVVQREYDNLIKSMLKQKEGNTRI